MSVQLSIPVALIVAQSLNRVIGVDNTLPWHLPEDLKYFKSVTLGKPIIMGRKTYESIGRPLPGRTNIVLTQRHNWSAEGVVVVHSPSEALAVAAKESPEEIMVIGGAEIYSLMLPLSQRIYLTQVYTKIDGDAFFPELPEGEWREVSRTLPQKLNDPEYVFLCMERCQQPVM